jgi:uncharacterized DUF497 family protein
MQFEWDEAKRRSNLRDHGIDFMAVEKERILAGETITQLDDRFEMATGAISRWLYSEGRW